MILKIMHNDNSFTPGCTFYDGCPISIERYKIEDVKVGGMISVDEWYAYEEEADDNKNRKERSYVWVASINNKDLGHVLRVAFFKGFIINEKGQTMEHFIF